MADLHSSRLLRIYPRQVIKREVILNLFQDPTAQVTRMMYTQQMGC
jgi:hypothetical protein